MNHGVKSEFPLTWRGWRPKRRGRRSLRFQVSVRLHCRAVQMAWRRTMTLSSDSPPGCTVAPPTLPWRPGMTSPAGSVSSWRPDDYSPVFIKRHEFVTCTSPGEMKMTYVTTRISVIAEGPRDALCPLKSCHLLHKCIRRIAFAKG